MYGSLAGNAAGAAFFLAFQALGICACLRLLARERLAFRLLLGSVLGSFALTWAPVPFAFFLGFTRAAHWAGLGLFALLALPVILFVRRPAARPPQARGRQWALVPMGLVYLYFAWVLIGHAIPVENGAMYTGQATYGDINLHLGIITNLANQGQFPPEYSIFPGVRLSYPFLCDSISAGVYLFGSSLRFAYCLPLLFAGMQAMAGFYLFAYDWLRRQDKALLAWILFFLNGGLGFCYFLDMVYANPAQFFEIFTGYYITPTSLGARNMRWAQVLVNMLIPQRATLMGWAVLFPLLALIRRAMKRRQWDYFLLAGILAGGLPMIHTHSFMALAIVCGGWLLWELVGARRAPGERVALLERPSRANAWIVAGGLIFFSLWQAAHLFLIDLTLAGALLVAAVGAGFAILLLTLLARAAARTGWRRWLAGWGVLLGATCLLALPQLWFWTFSQAGHEGFIYGHFNWSNTGDQYVWFYLKNVGLTMFFAVPALLSMNRGRLEVVFPAFLIWFAAEFVVFQPNAYDNNKLLFVAFALIACVSADYMIDRYDRIRHTAGGKALASLVFVGLTFSAGLTMARECVSKYVLYDEAQVALSEYVEANTDPDDVILTGTRHDNAISSLTGRRIVLGTSSFLYYHGIDYAERWQEVYDFYTAPGAHPDLIEKYDIDYILVGGEERSTYWPVDEEELAELYERVFSRDGVSLYAVQ